MDMYSETKQPDDKSTVFIHSLYTHKNVFVHILHSSKECYETNYVIGHYAYMYMYIHLDGWQTSTTCYGLGMSIGYTHFSTIVLNN